MFSGSHLDRIEAADAVDLKDATKTETNVRWSGGGEVDGGDTQDGTKSSAASWNRLAPIEVHQHRDLSLWSWSTTL